MYYFLSYFWSLIAIFANEVRAHEVLVVFLIHGLTKTVSLFLPGDKIIKDGQPAMQNAVTTNIFKAPGYWYFRRFYNLPSCNEKHLLIFSNLFAKESGFGTKGKFSFLLGGKFPCRDENMNFPGFFSLND